jgi:hypothetical protein
MEIEVKCKFEVLLLSRGDYGADFGHFFTKIGLLKSIFLETVRALIIISHVALFIPFHISHHIVKMPFTSYISPITSSTTPDWNAFRSHVAGLS